MNINFLSSSLQLNSLQKTKDINVSKPNYQKNNGADVFIKSTNKVSFGSIEKTKYADLKNDMTEYFMNSDELSVGDIRTIVKKYSPSTGFDDIRNAPQTIRINKMSGAYTHEPTQFFYNEKDKIEAETLPKTIYLNFHTPTKDEKESRIILLDRMLHEMTHLLQDEEGSDTRKLEFFNKYLDSATDETVAINSIQAFNGIFNILEQNMLTSFVKAEPTAWSLPREVNRRLDIDSLFMKKIKMSTSTLIRNSLSQAFNISNKQFGNIDTNTALDYVVLKAKNEKEAYQNGLDSDKELLGITAKTDFDLRIEMYQKIIETAESLKK